MERKIFGAGAKKSFPPVSVLHIPSVRYSTDRKTFPLIDWSPPLTGCSGNQPSILVSFESALKEIEAKKKRKEKKIKKEIKKKKEKKKKKPCASGATLPREEAAAEEEEAAE